LQEYLIIGDLFTVPIGFLGIKIGMTQIFSSTGICIPVTVLKVGPCIVTQIKTVQSDGYNAIQIGYLEIHSNGLTKAEAGHLNKSTTLSLKYLKEYKTDEPKQFYLGQIITLEGLKIGDNLKISGKSIGKGFSGYQQRHHFSRGPMSHGSKNHRQPGSIGAGTTPGRVFPGKRMAGRLGGSTITLRNIQIIDINTEQNYILVKGSIPGKPGNLLSIQK
jgi:large subunit ribosomal protein L3